MKRNVEFKKRYICLSIATAIGLFGCGGGDGDTESTPTGGTYTQFTAIDGYLANAQLGTWDGTTCKGYNSQYTDENGQLQIDDVLLTSSSLQGSLLCINAKKRRNS